MPTVGSGAQAQQCPMVQDNSRWAVGFHPSKSSGNLAKLPKMPHCYPVSLEVPQGRRLGTWICLC